MKEKRRVYIAYGSNINIRQMKERCPNAILIGTAELNNWELLFRGSMTGKYLTIEKKKKSKVPVVLWSVSESDERSLDRYEGFPHCYYKRNFRVLFNGRRIAAFAYIMQEERPYGLPTNYYLRTCAQGYDSFGFDLDFLWTAMERSKELEDKYLKKRFSLGMGYKR